MRGCRRSCSSAQRTRGPASWRRSRRRRARRSWAGRASRRTQARPSSSKPSRPFSRRRVRWRRPLARGGGQGRSRRCRLAGHARCGLRCARRHLALRTRREACGIPVPAVRPRQRHERRVSAGRHNDGASRRRPRPRRAPHDREGRHRAAARAQPRPRPGRGDRGAAPLLKATRRRAPAGTRPARLRAPPCPARLRARACPRTGRAASRPRRTSCARSRGACRPARSRP